jgi:hypothetical protein
MFLYSIKGSIAANASNDCDKQGLALRICAELKRFDWEATADGDVVSFLNNKNIFDQMTRLDRTTGLVDSGEFAIDGRLSLRIRRALRRAVTAPSPSLSP